MAVVNKSELQKELEQEVLDIIDGAFRALEAKKSTALARSQLREVSRKLQVAEFEFRGGCGW